MYINFFRIRSRCENCKYVKNVLFEKIIKLLNHAEKFQLHDIVEKICENLTSK